MADLYLQGGDPSVNATSSTGTAPANSDNVLVDGRCTVALTGASMLTVTLAKLDIVAQSYSIGSSAAPWQIGTGVLLVNRPPATGATQGPTTVALSLGTAPFSGTVFASPAGGASNQEPVLLAATNSANVLTVLGGSVGIATMTPGQTSTFGTVSASGSSIVNLGSGATLSLAEVSGSARVRMSGTLTVANVRGGVLTVDSASIVGTVTAYSGATVAIASRISGAEITSLVSEGGTLDLSSDPRPVSVTTLTLNAPLTVKVATDATQFTWGTLVIPTGRTPSGITFIR